MQSDIASLFPDLYQGVVETDALSQALDILFSRMFEEMTQSLDNQFIQTADIRGVEAFELLLEIRPQPGDTLQERRDRILIEWRSRIPYTYRALEAYLQDVTKGYILYLDHNAYLLRIQILTIGLSQHDALMKALRKMLPANMAIRLQVRVESKGSTFVGVSPHLAQTIRIRPYQPSAVNASIQPFVGLTARIGQSIQIQPKGA